MTLQHTAIIRAMIGLAQGLLLYLLSQAAESRFWPGTDPVVFAPLFTIAIFIPLIAASGFDNLRDRTLIIWLAAAAGLCAGLVVYDIYRNPALVPETLFFYGSPRLAPTL